MSALKQMDSTFSKSLLVMDGNHFVGLVTVGDIQRAILRNINLENSIIDIIDKNKVYAHITDSVIAIKQKMLELRAEMMPVIDDDGGLVKVYFWSDIFDEQIENCGIIDLPVVIMAGGQGTRLRPLTNIYPKPLIPVGEKTIIESIMDRFVSYSCHKFYLSVNYKADVIKNYFNFLNNEEYDIEYFQEDKPMGTAGSLRFLKDKVFSTFFVSNCDILVKENYAEVLNYHKTNHNELTVVAAIKNYSIPYGTIITGKEGILESLKEKPDLTFQINTGFYILESSVLSEIPDCFFHITHLMEKLKEQGRRVGVYPISQNDWIDMGDWDEYLHLIRGNK